MNELLITLAVFGPVFIVFGLGIWKDHKAIREEANRRRAKSHDRFRAEDFLRRSDRYVWDSKSGLVYDRRLDLTVSKAAWMDMHTPGGPRPPSP